MCVRHKTEAREITTCECGIVMFSVACVGLGNALMFKSLDLDSSFLVWIYVFRV